MFSKIVTYFSFAILMCTLSKVLSLDTASAIEESRLIIEEWRSEFGIPGVVAGVMIKGVEVWSEGFGFSDLENGVKTHKDSVWRLASISKSLTTALIGKLLESGKIHLDDSINDYLPASVFPKKLWKSNAVRITLRQVMSHTAGLRVSTLDDYFVKVFEASNATQAVTVFKDDPLIFEPGTNWTYSNYGFQIVGAIIESVLRNSYELEINKLFREIGLANTFAERLSQIIRHRPRYYQRYSDVNGVPQLGNAEIYDDLVSYTGWWPAGGLVSTASDLLKFGDIMLKSYNGKSNFLNSSTVHELWRPVTSVSVYKNTDYALGWFATNLSIADSPYLRQSFGHTGGLMGSSTFLAIFPEQELIAVLFANDGYVDNVVEVLVHIANYFAH